MVKSRKNLIVLFAALAGIVGTTFLSQLVKYIDWPLGRTVAKAVFYLLLGLIAWGAMKIVGMPVRIDFRKGRSYGIGLILALSLSAVIAALPALCGFSLVGGPAPFSWSGILYDLFFFLLFVGPVEEFVFRVWLQEALESSSSLSSRTETIWTISCSASLPSVRIFCGRRRFRLRAANT